MEVAIVVLGIIILVQLGMNFALTMLVMKARGMPFKKPVDISKKPMAQFGGAPFGGGPR